MKKITLAILGCLIFTITQAQTEKGDWMVGGSLSINTASGNSQVDLMPSAGYFFANHFAAGAQLFLDFAKIEDTKHSSFGIGPFARYYFELKNSPSVKPLLHASFTVGTVTDKGPGFKNSSTVSSLFLGGGCAFFVSHNVAIDAIAGYNRSKVENLPSQGGFMFTLGFQVHLLGSEVKKG